MEKNQKIIEEFKKYSVGYKQKFKHWNSLDQQNIPEKQLNNNLFAAGIMNHFFYDNQQDFQNYHITDADDIYRCEDCENKLREEDDE